MAARRRLTTGELGFTELEFIRDSKERRPDQADYRPWLWLRLDLELRNPKLFGAASKLAQIWRTGGPALIRELGLTRAKKLRCWKVFGDPRN